MPSRTRRTAAALSAIALMTACGGGSAGTPPDPEGSNPAARFSSERVLAELEGLLAIGPRPSGSEGAAAARTQLRAALEDARIPVESVESTVELEGESELVILTHLVATLPGASTDRFLLVAPYDGGDPEADADAATASSGAALLVELARVLALRDFPYTLQFVWIEGEGPLGQGPEALHDMRWLGSRSLASDWAEEGRLDGIRLLVAVNRICSADLDVARDLGSHRHHRGALFRAARRLGRAAEFPTNRDFASVVASHLGFRSAGLRPVVAIEDTPAAVPEGEAEATASPEACSSQSVETVGLVLLEGLDSIATRLAKIDRFSRVPAAEPREPATEGSGAKASAATRAGPEDDPAPEAPVAP